MQDRGRFFCLILYSDVLCGLFFTGQHFILPGENGKIYPVKLFEGKNIWPVMSENLE